MVCKFGLRHVLLVRRLQALGVCLDLEHSVLHPHPPLIKAITGRWSLAEGPTCTFVLRSRMDGVPSDGFVQARLRPGGREADIEFIAPVVEDPGVRAQMWSALLIGMAQGLGRHGVERVYARLADELEDAGTFQQVGFLLYTREDVFQLSATRHRKRSGILRPSSEADWWGIDRLYAAVTPRAVQAAEGLNSSSPGRSPRRALGSEGQVLLAERDGVIHACVEVAVSSKGQWIRLTVDLTNGPDPAEILDDALAALMDRGPWPVYCSVRAYQGRLRIPLQDLGFRFVTSQAVWVKTALVRVKEPLAQLVPALRRRPELRTPTSLPAVVACGAYPERVIA